MVHTVQWSVCLYVFAKCDYIIMLTYMFLLYLTDSFDGLRVSDWPDRRYFMFMNASL